MAFTLDHIRSAPSRGLPALTSLFAVARQRRALARLDADQLADIGVSVEEAQIEANRPMWDAPNHWSR